MARLTPTSHDRRLYRLQLSLFCRSCSGSNADIRKTCDELAEHGFVAVAPDLFWRQEPGVELSVTSEADWQHGLRLYQAYDRDAGVT
jgi:dienelactone hydrolase